MAPGGNSEMVPTESTLLLSDPEKTSNSIASSARNLHARQEAQGLEALHLDGLTSNVVPSLGNLDRHADEPIVGNEVRRKKPSTWDPLARYYSEAHSFPNYGSRRLKMIPKLMQICDAFRPVNTLSQPSRTSHPPKDEPAAKRQKKDPVGGAASTTSPYFAQAATPRRGLDNISVDGSREDRLEIGSSSSAATGKLGRSKLQILEMQGLPRSFGKKTRQRNSRNNKYNVGHYRNEKDGSPATPSFKQSQIKSTKYSGNLAADSPDTLALADPPANVTSDIGPQNRTLKRGLPSQATMANGPHVKRTKPSQRAEAVESGSESESPDELSHGSDKPPNNFTTVRNPERGDIPSTKFSNLRHANATKPMPKPLLLARALTPRHEYTAEDGEIGAIYLRAEGSPPKRLVPKSKSGKPSLLPWLDIDLAKITGCRHHSTRSPHVSLQRPQSSGIPAKLFLEFDSMLDATTLVDLLPESVSCVSVEPDVLRNEMQHVSKELESFRDKLKRNGRMLEGRAIAHNAAEQSGIAETQTSVQRSELSKETSSQTLQESPTMDVDNITAMPNLPDRSPGRETRSTRRQSPRLVFRDYSPPRWTTSNPDWEAKWSKSLIFPATGKNRATVDKDDISRLDEGQFLNDNLINFYIRYLQIGLEQTQPELLKKVYFFNTFFFEKLRSTKGKINYEGVKAWTAKIDVFSYEYIVVPVNENAHWYLAIICNTPNTTPREPDCDSSLTLSQNEVEIVGITGRGHLTKSKAEGTPSGVGGETPSSRIWVREGASDDADPGSPGTSVQAPMQHTPVYSKRSKSGNRSKQKYEPGHPKIITLDSLGSPHSPTCTALREYLTREAEAKKGVELAVLPAGMTARGIPEQDNYCDCGVFILGYMEEFLKNPDEAVEKLLRKEELGWTIRASELRQKLRDLIFRLQEEQQRRSADEAEKKRLAIAQRKAAKAEKTRALPTQVNSAAGTKTPPAKKTPDTETESKPGFGISHKFVSPLKDSPKSEAPSVASSNALPMPRSQDGRRARVEVQLRSQSSPNDEFLGTRDKQFTQSLPDSPSESSRARDAQRSKKQFASEPTKPKANSASPRQQRKLGRGFHASPRRASSPQAIESIEKDDSQQSRGGPRYDGIERSIDLTK